MLEALRHHLTVQAVALDLAFLAAVMLACLRPD